MNPLKIMILAGIIIVGVTQMTWAQGVNDSSSTSDFVITNRTNNRNSDITQVSPSPATLGTSDITADGTGRSDFNKIQSATTGNIGPMTTGSTGPNTTGTMGTSSTTGSLGRTTTGSSGSNTTGSIGSNTSAGTLTGGSSSGNGSSGSSSSR